MITATPAGDLQKQLTSRLAQLPPAVQNAIRSAELGKKLRGLADAHKLHIDQWQILENEVMLALFGFQPIEKLESNIQQEVGLPPETAQQLVSDINRVIFEPIREELERQLAHPEAKEKEVSGVEAAREEALAGTREEGRGMEEKNASNAQPEAGSLQPAADSNSDSATSYKLQATSSIAPPTPPAPPPTEKIPQPQTSSAYSAGQPSTARADVQNDPYREPPL